MNIVLFGAPGSGKGTQALLLKEKYGMVHFSTGEVLRKKQEDTDSLAQEIRSALSKGAYLPDDLILEIVRDFLSQPKCMAGVIFDGIPRTIDQAHALNKILQENKKTIDHVIEIDVNDEVLRKRLVGRFACKTCGEGYNDYFKLPLEKGVCDVCSGTEFVRRADDVVDTVERRLALYRAGTESLIHYYQQLELYEKVDGGQAVQVVADAVNNIIEKRK